MIAMEEDMELEEGETKEPCDPDKDFSYIDQKLYLLLGDQQKEFQGCTISTEKLGSKFGGYGTFLPTQARAPSMLANPSQDSHVPELTEGNNMEQPMKSMAGKADQAMDAQPHGDKPLPQPLPKQKNAMSRNDPGVSKKVMIRFKICKGIEKATKSKAIQNGLSLAYLSSASLEDDDKHNLSNAELSPEPSPSSMIQIMLSYHTPQCLLSPLPPSYLEYLDYKDKAPIRLKVNKGSKTPLTVHIHEGKGDLDGGKERKVKENERVKQTGGIEMKIVCEAVVVDTGKKAGRDSDAEKQIQKEPVLKGSANVVRNDATKGEEQVASIVKVVEGPSKEDIELGKELVPKSSHSKQTDLRVEHSVIISKEKDGSDVKGSRKLSAGQDKDNEETSGAKEIVKPQAHINQEATKFIASVKNSTDKIGTLLDGWKQGKHWSKEIPIFKAKEVLREVKKERQRKSSIGGDFTARNGNKETGKPAAKGEWAMTNEPSNVASQKDLTRDMKRLKTVPDRKVGKKERNREQGPLLEAMPKIGNKKLLGRVDTAAALAVVATDTVVMPSQLVLDNWVQCDKCETWRLLLPGIDTPDSSAKWNCKMMVWMPGMNNCKFMEEETTAAVYSYLGLQNPKPASTTGVPAELPPSFTDIEPVSKMSAIQADTKKSSTVTTGKKGPIDSLVTGGVKTAGSKGAPDGSLKSKTKNNVGLDGNGDGIAYTCVLADTNKLKENKKNKRQLSSGGEDLPMRKKVAHGAEKHIQEGSTLKHLGGDILKGEETLHTEGNRVGRERNEAEAQAVTSISVKRKNQIEIADEGNVKKSVKKSKGNNNRVLSNHTGTEEDARAREHVNDSQRHKPGADVKKLKNGCYSTQADIDAEKIVLVVKDYTSSPGFYGSGEIEKGQAEKENRRKSTDGRRGSKLDLTKVHDLKRRFKGHEREDSEQLEGKRPKQDVHRHAHLESKGHVTRMLLPSEPVPEILELGATSSALAAPLNLIRSKNERFKKEVLNHSIPSKIFPSPELSGIRSMAHGDPIGCTVLSSPLQLRTGEREQSSDQQGGAENVSVPKDVVLQQNSCPASPKHEEDALHPFSWDEGEFHHAAVTWNRADAFRKHDCSCEPHAEDWNWDEHRGLNTGLAYDHHQDASAEQWQTESNQDQHECDGQYERRDKQNDHFDVACDQEGRDQQSKGGVDAQEDQYPGECSTRDDWGRPSSQESHLDKTGVSSWHDEQLEHVEDAPTKDEALPGVTEHGARDCNLGTKGSIWEGKGTAPVSRKESDTVVLCPLDATVSSRGPRKALVQLKDSTEETLKQVFQPGQLKALVNSGRDGEGATSSPIKKEHSHANNPAFSAAESEGRALKHSADGLKNQPGLEIESTNLYLQAALKFLQAASIVENENTERNRAGETQSMVVYNHTATLCKYCADKYERSHDIAAAALAYTCAAVALGRRMLCKNVCFASDHSELYAAVQQMHDSNITLNGPLLPPPLPSRSTDKPGPSIAPGSGESPSSSSASDADYLNNHSLGTSDKSAKVQMIGRPATASPRTMPGTAAAAAPSSYIIPPHLHSSFTQFLKDANDMSNLLEAWQKAANMTAKVEATCDQKGMHAVKRVGELGGFGDIETVVCLVQVAMDSIGH